MGCLEASIKVIVIVEEPVCRTHRREPLWRVMRSHLTVARRPVPGKISRSRFPDPPALRRCLLAAGAGLTAATAAGIGEGRP